LLIVAGLSLKNLEPRVWDPDSPHHIPGLSAVMISYGDFHQMRARRSAAMEQGLRTFLRVPDGIQIYLDNGAFYFGSQGGEVPVGEYEEFVEKAKPDWKPIPQDYIPFPSMTGQKRWGCFAKTMRVNLQYQHNGYVPVVHIGSHLEQYTARVNADEGLSKKPWIALGAIVPNLLRKTRALPYTDVLVGLQHVRETFRAKSIHVFGVGGTATLHLTALLGFDSVDSSGWRNRAARGIVQLPGSGERLVAGLGKWRGRSPSDEEWRILHRCKCPTCRRHGAEGLKADRLHGFCCRATHNLWVLLEENRWLTKHISAGTYANNYKRRVDNSTYKPIIEELLGLLKQRDDKSRSPSSR
jgi:7-cyano-7-deazaguanine tRNA-ribosyltransferase